MMKDKVAQYHTTAYRCGCPDYTFRGCKTPNYSCKHMIYVQTKERFGIPLLSLNDAVDPINQNELFDCFK